MAEIACAQCHKKRPGRFTRLSKSVHPGGKFNQGRTMPSWYCYGCLPQGQGADETEEPMARQTTLKKAAPAAPVIDITPLKPSALLADKRAAMAIIPTLQEEASGLQVRTEEDYLVADGIFGRVKQARKAWKLKMYGTKDKLGPIPSIRHGLDMLYELNREVDTPLENLENALERQMKGFKLAEQRRLQAEEEERQRVAVEAQRKIDELQRRQEALKTPAAKAKVEEQILEAAEDLDAVQQEEVSTAVVGQNSGIRPKKIPVVTDRDAFLKGVLEGTIPDDCIDISMVKVRAYYKEDPEAVKLFPGVEIQDDIQIVGRSM